MSQDQKTETSQSPDVDADLQKEIDEALGDQSVEQLMEDSVSAEAPANAGESEGDAAPSGDEAIHHDIRRGRVSAIRGDDVFIDLAGEDGKLQGVVPLQQFDRPPRLGSIMDFVVDHIDEGQGLVFLSREGAISRSTWDQLTPGSVVEARVVATNKGGLELEMVGGIRAFMPASQVDIHHVKDLESFVGQKLEGRVQELDRKSKKVVISRRNWLEQQRAAQKEKVLGELEIGQVVEGKVSSLVDFGAFVTLGGGVDGLVHVSDLSYAHVDKPGDVLKVGETVTVKVLKIDKGGERIGLGLKQVQPDPWENIGERVRVGDQVTARIVRTTNFGAFVELEPGVEGLLPLSEMSWKRIGKAEEVVKAGDTLRMSVLSMDPGKKRLSLSLKQATGDPWVGAERKYEKGSLVQGKVIGTTDFGAFVELEPGVEGLVHISELSDRRVGQVTDVLNVGDEKELRVIEISEDARKVKLSLKQVAAMSGPSPAEQAQAAAEAARMRAPRRSKPKNLKSGLGDGGGLGMGLGDLKLDDFK